MNYSLELEIEGLPKLANQLLRGHWRVKYGHTKLWKQKVATKLRFAVKPLQPLVYATAKFIRVSASEPDYDGLVSGFKPIIDALVENGILVSDKSSCLINPKFLWEKGKRGQGKIKIKVAEIKGEEIQHYKGAS